MTHFHVLLCTICIGFPNIVAALVYIAFVCTDIQQLGVLLYTLIENI